MVNVKVKKLVEVILAPRNFGYLLFLFFLIFILRFNSLETFFERDEGEYAYSAWIMKNGGVLYGDAFLQKPPMIVYTYYFAQFIKDGIVMTRVLAFVFVFLSSLLVGYIARYEFGKRYFWLSAVIFGVIVNFPGFTPFAANTEIFMLLPMLGVIAIYEKYRFSNKNYWHLIAGSLAMIALMYKPICILVVGFVFLVWAVEIVKKNNDIKDLFYRGMFWLFGMLIAGLLILLPIILSGQLRPFWEEVVVFNRSYAISWGWDLGAFVFQMKRIAKYYWILVIITPVFLLARPKRWWFLIGCFVFSLLSVYQSYIGHYYLLVVPFWAILIGWIICYFCDAEVFKKIRYRREMFFGFFMVFMLWGYKEQFSLTGDQLGVWVYGNLNPFFEAQTIAHELARFTSSTDRVFIAGSEPEILYYAKRKSMSRFVITYPLIVETPLRLSYQKEIIREFETSFPKAIVYSQREYSGLWNEESPRLFIDYLNSLIENEYELAGGYVWKNGRGYWSNQLSEEEKKNSSLLLYILRDEKNKS